MKTSYVFERQHFLGYQIKNELNELKNGCGITVESLCNSRYCCIIP